LTEGIIILIVLTAISGILSSLEIALSSSNKNKVKSLAEDGSKQAQRLLSAMNNPGKFFATTQFYITFIAYFMGAFTAALFTEPLAKLLVHTGLPLTENVAELTTFIIITACLTYLALVFGELVPKRIVLQNPMPFALKTIGFLNFLSIIGLPFVKALSISSTIVLKIMGIKDKTSANDIITREDVRLMVEASGEHGHIAENEQDMIENIFEFDKLTADDVCTHRIDVVALPIDADFNQITDLFIKEKYTRLPVYDGNLDNVIGILHTKDIIPYLAQKSDVPFDLRTILREPYFVLSSKRTDELLQEMRKKKICMAVVIDEYGGMTGIVSIDDLIEPIMGSIKDEYDYDEEIPEISEISENNYRIRGSTPLETVRDFLELSLPTDDYDTLSGFVVGFLGYIPQENETPQINYENFTFKVERVQERRIATVLVSHGIA
jgi:putative hemolysin